MQDILSELLWRSGEIDEAAARLCQTLPGYQEARQAYDSLAEQIQAAVGYELYDQYYAQMLRCTDYEVRAYYIFGLGLREELVQALGL